MEYSERLEKIEQSVAELLPITGWSLDADVSYEYVESEKSCWISGKRKDILEFAVSIIQFVNETEENESSHCHINNTDCVGEISIEIIGAGEISCS